MIQNWLKAACVMLCNTLIFVSIICFSTSCLSPPFPSSFPPAEDDILIVPLLPAQTLDSPLPQEPFQHPAIPKETRGTWIASLQNLDWPSTPFLSVEQQQQEVRDLLDALKELQINTVLLQVRPLGDSLYFSPQEPWTSFLSGQQGLAPHPFYDPLSYWIQESHKRGISLHAWINPYRVGIPSIKTYSPHSLVQRWKQKPYLISLKKGYHWLDPGHLEVRKYLLELTEYLLKSYAIDGLVLDDYYYPYPEYLSSEEDFLDQASYEKFALPSESRADFRRRAVEQLLQELLSLSTKYQTPLGVSFFGIYQPNEPKGIRGLNSLETLFTDTKKWVNQGAAHFFSPQLYWPTTAKYQAFAALLQWWKDQNSQQHGLWPSLAFYKYLDDLTELQRQIASICPPPPEAEPCGFFLYGFPRYLLKNSLLKAKIKEILPAKQSLFPPLPFQEPQQLSPPVLQLIRDHPSHWELRKYPEPQAKQLLLIMEYSSAYISVRPDPYPSLFPLLEEMETRFYYILEANTSAKIHLPRFYQEKRITQLYLYHIDHRGFVSDPLEYSFS